MLQRLTRWYGNLSEKSGRDARKLRLRVSRPELIFKIGVNHGYKIEMD